MARTHHVAGASLLVIATTLTGCSSTDETPDAAATSTAAVPSSSTPSVSPSSTGSSSEPLCVKVPSAEARGLAGREVAVVGTAGRVPWPDGPEGFWVYAVPVTIPTSNSESFDDATFYFAKKPEGNSLTYSAEALTNEFAEFPIVPSGNLYGDAILDSASECAGAFG